MLVDGDHLDVWVQAAQGLCRRFDLGPADVVDAVEELAKKKRKKVLLNLAGVTYVDSCGIGHLVRAISKARRLNVDLKLANAAAPVFALLRMTHLERIVDIADSEPAGIAAFGAAPTTKK